MTKEDKIGQLKEYLDRRNDVMFAFLFGSRTEAKSRSESDWDIAIYFKPRTAAVEFENSDLEYPQENEVWSDLTKLLETDKVDLINLNAAPASIADTALRGLPLVMKDRNLWFKFMLLVTSLAEDYRRWAHDYHQIVQRSRSISPADRERLERLIDFIQKQEELYSVYRQFSWNNYEQDTRKRNEIERWLENIVNAVIDMAKGVIGSKKYLIPPTYRETVASALRTLNLPDDFETKFEEWIRLRNILAHEYLDIKWKKLEQFAQTSEPYINKFVSAIGDFLKNENRSSD